MAGHKRPDTLAGRVRDFVLANGPCTSAQVAGALGRHVGTPQAVAAGRLRLETNRRAGFYRVPGGEERFRAQWADTGRLAAAGRRRILTKLLGKLARQGDLRRLAPATYGPPLPRLHDPEGLAAPPPETPPGQAGTG